MYRLISLSAARSILKATSGATLYVNLAAILISLEDFTEYLIFLFFIILFYFLEQIIYLNGVSCFISSHVITLLFVIVD